MPAQNENTSAVGVQIKTATISSTKLAIAVAFLGAAALAAAAAGTAVRRVEQMAKQQKQQYGYAAPVRKVESMVPLYGYNASEGGYGYNSGTSGLWCSYGQTVTGYGFGTGSTNYCGSVKTLKECTVLLNGIPFETYDKCIKSLLSPIKLVWGEQNTNKLMVGDDMTISDVKVYSSINTLSEIVLLNLPLTIIVDTKPDKDRIIRVYEKVDNNEKLLSAKTIKVTDWVESNGNYEVSILNELTSDKMVIEPVNKMKILRVSIGTMNGKKLGMLCASMNDKNLGQLQWQYLSSAKVFDGINKKDGLITGKCLIP